MGTRYGDPSSRPGYRDKQLIAPMYLLISPLFRVDCIDTQYIHRASLVIVFATLYLFRGFVRPVAPDGSAGAALSISQLPGDPSVLWESLYYSTLTFTALGFGDFRPIDAFGQMFTVIETSFGALLLALLVFVLGRRAAR